MAMYESLKRKACHHKHGNSNANEVPLGKRKRSHEKDINYSDIDIESSPKQQDTAITKDTISDSLRQIRNKVSNSQIPPSVQGTNGEVSSSKASRDVLPNRKSSIKDRLGPKPARGRGKHYNELNDYHKNNQYSGRDQRGGASLCKGRGYSRGFNASSHQSFRGRGTFLGGAGQLSSIQSSNTNEGAFPHRNMDACNAYPIPM